MGVVVFKPVLSPPAVVELTVMLRPSAAVNVTTPVPASATAVTPVCDVLEFTAAAV